MRTVKSAKFIKSMDNFDEYEGLLLPEVVLVGRSNVGKSSLINMLSHNNKLAKVSSTQGKTRLVNFFTFNKEFVLVDLPGYGYAKTSKVEQQKWSSMIDNYLRKSENLKMAIILVDIRHNPTEQDIQMLEYFTYHNIPVTICATKYDKIKKSEKIQKLTAIAHTFNVGLENIYLTSSETAFGKANLLDRIYQFIDGE
ncbi:MAG: YihA family ribosome biogenesis GTP-binding protein [Clostridia bacterium]|nr:YihA family ribosome biogenesis GTP-binding protein [Clostridia bacterium]